MYFMFIDLMFTKVFQFYLYTHLLSTDDYRKIMKQVTCLIQLKYNFHKYIKYCYQQNLVFTI